jgi:2'-5' RNA ligase
VTRGNDDLIALDDALYTGLLATALDRSSVFVPHVTGGRVDDASALYAALDSVDHHRTWEFELQALMVYRLGDARPGQIEAVLSLSSSPTI